MFRSTFHLLTFIVAVTASSVSSTEDSNNNELILTPNNEIDNDIDYYDGHRELQLADRICPIIEDTIFQGLATCECGLVLLAGEFDVACESTVCSPADILCGTVGFATNFTVFPPSLGASLCINDITLSVLNIDLASLGPFCIDYSTVQVRNSCPKGIPNCVRTGKISTAPRNSNVKSCTIKVGDKQCKTCTPCNNNGGVTFDCTNVAKKFKVNKCANFNAWFGVGSKPKVTLPDLVLAK